MCVLGFSFLSYSTVCCILFSSYVKLEYSIRPSMYSVKLLSGFYSFVRLVKNSLKSEVSLAFAVIYGMKGALTDLLSIRVQSRSVKNGCSLIS